MKMKVLLCLVTFSLAIASAAANSFTVTLTNSVWVSGTELKPGEYKLVMSGDKAVFTKGKVVVEVPATMEQATEKFASTTVLARDAQVKEIDLGKTTSKIIFTPTADKAVGTK